MKNIETSFNKFINKLKESHEGSSYKNLHSDSNHYDFSPNSHIVKDTKYTVTVLTEEGQKRHENTDKAKDENYTGYHFLKSNREKAEKFKEELEKEGTYNDEKIIKIVILPASSGMGMG